MPPGVVIIEGQLTFTFPMGWQAVKYDDWKFYRKQFIKTFGSPKAIDVLAIDNVNACWHIEIKDYRQFRRTKTIDITEEMATKVFDTMAGLVAASVNANDANERAFATRALRGDRLCVVLHLEQPQKHSKLFPRKYVLANVQQKLRQLIRAIDPHARVVDIQSMGALLWTVT